MATIPLSTVRAAISSEPARAPAGCVARRPLVDIEACFDLPLMESRLHAQRVHRDRLGASEVQLSTRRPFETGGRPPPWTTLHCSTRNGLDSRELAL